VAGPDKKRFAGFELRLTHVALVIVAVASMLMVQLWQLQVVQGQYYQVKARDERIHYHRIKAPRGMIYGRDESVVLADNRPSCDLMMVRADAKDPLAVCRRLEQLVHINAEALFAQLEQAKQPFTQILVKRDLSKADLMRVEEHAHELPGVFAVVHPQRRYLHGDTAGQILGYLNEVDRDDLARLPEYRMGDLIGRMGIEKMYEGLMRGKDGQMQISVYNSDRRPQLRTDSFGIPYVATDKYGRKLAEETEYRKEPVAGDALYLTLDIEVQALAEKLLEGEQGAIVVLEADTGAVLALASAPGFDPNIFVTPDPSGQRLEVLTGKPSRLMNRCIEEAFPPGSVFKLLVAMAGLEEGVINERTTFFCGGRYLGEGFSKRCHSSHGSVALEDAIARSCDVYFYNVGRMLGVERLHDWSRTFNFGKKTGIDLPGEIAAIVPNRAWKEEFFKDRLAPENRRWFPPETLDFSIGQGFLNTTALQCAVLTASVMNGGRIVRPYLNMALGPDVSEPLVSQKTVDLVRNAAITCVASPRGTGRRARVDGLVMLGKTGTAQVVSQKWNQGLTDEQIPYHRRDHAWFVAGVLDPDRPIAICVLVEHGLHGSTGASPLAKKLVEFMFADKLSEGLVARTSGPGA
jgi:penicillin-binding protein 2